MPFKLSEAGFQMQFFSLLLFNLVILASANRLPNNGSTTTTKCSGTITAKFDDLPMRPPAAVPIAIGPYRGLKYNGVNLLTPGVLGSPPPTGVMPASKPNVAVFGSYEIASLPNVTVIGGDAGYKIFNPSRIAYGCIIGSYETVSTVPASCTLRFSGYKAGIQLVSQFLTYEVANGQLTKAMSVASLQGFAGVDTVRLELVTPSPLVVAVLLDDFMYAGCS